MELGISSILAIRPSSGLLSCDRQVQTYVFNCIVVSIGVSYGGCDDVRITAVVLLRCDTTTYIWATCFWSACRAYDATTMLSLLRSTAYFSTSWIRFLVEVCLPAVGIRSKDKGPLQEVDMEA